jgi:hypothetical protein
MEQRMRTVAAPNGSTRPRRGRLALLIYIRSFYRDPRSGATGPFLGAMERSLSGQPRDHAGTLPPPQTGQPGVPGKVWQ